MQVLSYTRLIYNKLYRCYYRKQLDQDDLEEEFFVEFLMLFHEIEELSNIHLYYNK